MLLLVNCALQFADRAGGIAEEAGECRADAGLRPRAFEHDAVEDFDLIEMVALRFKELPPLVDGGFHNGIVVVGERNLRPVLFEEILVDVEAGAEGFERGFQPLDGILLLRMVKALVVHAGDAQHHPQIAALGQKRRLVPEAVEVDVVVERRGSLSTA